MIPIYKPCLPPGSLQYAHDALHSTWLSSQGKYLQMVQEKLQELLNVKYVQLLNNGTSACHLMAKCAARQGKQEVIVPNNSYAAAYNSFLFDGNWKSFSVECDINTWNYDLIALDTAIKNHPEAIILIVHNLGNTINVPKLQKQYPNNIFVEDACESFMGKYEGKYSGTSSFVSAFSTFANKTITSGEGGFLITNNEEAYLYAKCVQGQGQSERRFIHHELGHNYRMTNIAAAILYGQLEILPEILKKKQDIFDRYQNFLKNREDILLQVIEPNTFPSNWMFGIRIPRQQNYEIANIYFHNKGIEIRPMFYPITAHQYLVNSNLITIGNCAVAEQLNNECIILPSFPDLMIDEQNYILNILLDYVASI